MFDDLKGRQPGLVDFSEYKKFALGIPLLFYEGRLCILFEVRAKTLSRQPGEVCVPGGSVEDGEDFVTAAVRETMEELMISREQVEVIAPMDIYISVSGQIIAPYLMYLKNYKGTYNAAEVDEVFFVPLEFFLVNEPERYKNRIFTEPEEDFPAERIPGGRKYPWRSGVSTVFFYPMFQKHQIWGLTAKIIYSAVKIMCSSGLPQE